MRIEGKNVGRQFGKNDAIQHCTFECLPGEIIALIGNNGAGKTTLLQLIAGLLVPTSGEILVDGENLNRRNEEQRRRIAIIPDFPPFFAGHTVLQHIAMVCTLHQVPTGGLDESILALMEEIGILSLGNAQMITLSRGEVYKVVLLSLLVVKPDLWLIDEPMASGMDPKGLTFLRTHLREAAQAGSTVIYSTQIAEIAERFSDRIFVLKEGKLLAQESAPTLMGRFGAVSLEAALEKTFAE